MTTNDKTLPEDATLGPALWVVASTMTSARRAAFSSRGAFPASLRSLAFPSGWTPGRFFASARRFSFFAFLSQKALKINAAHSTLPDERNTSQIIENNGRRHGPLDTLVSVEWCTKSRANKREKEPQESSLVASLLGMITKGKGRMRIKASAKALKAKASGSEGFIAQEPSDGEPFFASLRMTIEKILYGMTTSSQVKGK